MTLAIALAYTAVGLALAFLHCSKRIDWKGKEREARGVAMEMMAVLLFWPALLLVEVVFRILKLFDNKGDRQ